MKTTSPDDLPFVLTSNEAFEFLRLGKSAGYEALRTGRLKSVKSGAKYLVPKAAVLKFLETRDQD
jgi:excisionase family DNA binding protein